MNTMAKYELEKYEQETRYKQYKAFADFLLVTKEYSDYHKNFMDGYFEAKKDLIENYYGNLTKTFEQFDPKDLDRIILFTKENGEVRINDEEKRIFSNAINYAKIHQLDLKKDYHCYLTIDIMNVPPIINTTIKTTIVIKAISQEYLEMTDEDYEDYLCWRASDIFTQKVLNIIPFFNEVGGGHSIPSFSYKIIEYV